MPELPDLTVYAEHLERRVVGEPLNAIRLASPFLLRSVAPTVDDVVGRRVVAVRRLAKQLVLALEGDCFMVLHLMIAGRLRWHGTSQAVPKRLGLAAFDFASGCLVLTEASKKKRAALRLVESHEALEALDPGGLEVFDIDAETFHARLQATPHTIKRALTDQRVFAGIGNAYSDEILFRAGMSPFQPAPRIGETEARGLYDACRDVLAEWTERLRANAGDAFPGERRDSKVTAFHPEMAVHGKYRQPCPVCGSPVLRIVRAENESNYCAKCQTDGRILADRSLSRLLKETYPKRIEELEG